MTRKDSKTAIVTAVKHEVSTRGKVEHAKKAKSVSKKPDRDDVTSATQQDNKKPLVPVKPKKAAAKVSVNARQMEPALSKQSDESETKPAARTPTNDQKSIRKKIVKALTTLPSKPTQDADNERRKVAAKERDVEGGGEEDEEDEQVVTDADAISSDTSCAIYTILFLVLAVIIVVVCCLTFSSPQPTITPPKSQWDILMEERLGSYTPPDFDYVNCTDQCAEPHYLHFFPRIIEQTVTFPHARRHCSPFHQYNYDLSGLDQANVMFLKATAHIVAKVRGSGVWVGGFLNITSGNPYLIHWLDGRVSDSKKSPKDIWCKGNHPRDVVPSKPSDQISYIPIVRLKNESDCLTLLTEKPYETHLHPLCVTRPAQLFLQLGNDLAIRPFFERLFAKEDAGFTELYQRGQTFEDQDKDKLFINTFEEMPRPFLTYESLPTMLVGFKEHVTYNYAQELCRNVYLRVGSPRGSMLTNHTLNPHVFNFVYNALLQKIYRDNALSPLPIGSSLTTAGRFDLASENYAHLAYDDGVKRWPGALNTYFKACNKVDLKLALKRAHDEFRQWYETGGKSTTGPYHAYLALDVKHANPCIRLVVDDLYWPGTHQWVPLCEYRKEMQLLDLL